MTDAIEAHERLQVYRGRKGDYRQELGEAGERLLHTLCEGSPARAQEFLGYARGGSARTNISSHWKVLGLPINRAHAGSVEPDPWKKFSTDPTVDVIREKYALATSGVERALQVDWTVPKGTEYAMLVAFSDLHYGHKAMDYARWMKLRDWIGENPDVRWIMQGDLLDLATTQSPGTSMSDQALNFEEARDLAEADLAPIASQGVALLTGNHELRVARALQLNYDPVREMAKNLRIPHLGYEGWVQYNVSCGSDEQTYTGYHHHGAGGGQQWGAIINKGQRLADQNQADIVSYGHVHRKVALETLRAYVNDDGIVDYRSTQILISGSFLKHLGYPREKMLSPSVLGAATAHFYTERHAVHARA